MGNNASRTMQSSYLVRAMRLCQSVLIVLTIGGLVGCDAPSSNQPVLRSELIGVWLITETATTTPAGKVVNDQPQPGIYIFTDSHFSNVLIPGSGRALFSDTPTDQERLTAYDNFITDIGTYDATDSTLTTHNIIAKVPNVMTGGIGITYRYRVEGDTLRLTFSGAWAPRDGEITYQLRRLE